MRSQVSITAVGAPGQINMEKTYFFNAVFYGNFIERMFTVQQIGCPIETQTMGKSNYRKLNSQFREKKKNPCRIAA